MTTPSEVDYALLAGAVYVSNRNSINQLPAPPGWTKLTYESLSSSGFEAASFTDSDRSQIVIAFAGTNPTSLEDWLNNIELGAGIASTQLEQAVTLYLQAVAANPTTTISFTGHSLGGGLASLMAVLFNQKAQTFDEAPFQNAASGAVAQKLMNYLNAQSYTGSLATARTTLVGDLNAFITAWNKDNPNGYAGTSTVIPNASNVTDTYVHGEFLSSWVGLDDLGRIGSQQAITLGGSSRVSGLDLHSIGLLDVCTISDQVSPSSATFTGVTSQLTDLVPMLFNGQLFSYSTALSNKKYADLLELLVQHQEGVGSLTLNGKSEASIAPDDMIGRFTADLWTIVQPGGLTMSNTYMRDALTAFVMQKYYYEGVYGVDPGTQLFTSNGAAPDGSTVSNGLEFNIGDLEATVNGVGPSFGQVKGYKSYFQKFLADAGGTTGLSYLTGAERALIQKVLPGMQAWYIQAGTSGMFASEAGSANAFMLGGAVSNDLLGGSGNDLLVGGATGNDTLDGGGAGNDTLIAGGGADLLVAGQGSDTIYGGSGDDTFNFVTSTTGTGTETIIDPNGNGAVEVDGTQLTALKLETLTQTAWTATDSKGDQYQYVASQSDPYIGTLDITGGLLNTTGNKIVIDDFNLSATENTAAGFLGISFWTKLAMEGGASNATPFAAGPPANQTVSVASGNAQTVTIYASSVSNTAQTVQVSASGAGSYALSLGSQLVSLSSPVNVTIPAGEDHVTASLVDLSTTSQSDTAQLTATTTDAGGTAVNSNTLGVTFDSPGAGLTGAAASETLTQPNDYAVVYPSGTTPTLYFPAYLSSSSNTLVQPTTNQNEFVSVSGGDSTVFGGTGNDWLNNTGPGGNLISGGGGQDTLTTWAGDNQIFGNSPVSESTALANRAGTPTNAKGSLIAAYGGNNLIVGSDGNDGIVTGGGNNTIICGPGANHVFGGVLTGASAAVPWPDSGESFSYVTASSSAGQQVAKETPSYIPPSWSATYTVTTTSTSVNYSIAWATPLLLQGDSTLSVPSAYYGPLENGVAVGVTNDTIFGGTGNSTYVLSNGNNWLDAGGGNDYVWTGIGHNTIFGGGGKDTIFAGGGKDYIKTESGSDYVELEGGNNTIIGGTGADTLVSGLSGPAWATSATSANNYIDGGAGNSYIFGSDGNDTLLGGTGNTSIYGGDGNESIVGGSGNVSIVGGTGQDTIYAGGAGTDTIFAGNGQASVYGGGGTDFLIGGTGTDLIHAGDGGTTSAPTQLYAGSGTGTLYGGAGVDQLFGTTGNDVLYAGSGTSTLQGGSGADALYGGTGNDTLIAGSGLDTLNGGSGTNVLEGTSGTTTFVAGPGNETIIGGSGTNIYQFNPGFGNVELDNGSGTYTFSFGAGISISDLSVTATLDSNGAPALLIQTDTGGNLTIAGGLAGAINQFTFSDGTVLTLDQLMTQASVAPTTDAGSSGDLLFVGNGSGSLEGGAGSDTLYGWGGANTLLAGSGNQALYSASGTDTLIGGSGNDTLTSVAGNDSLVGGTGDTTFVVDSTTDTIQAQLTGTNVNTVESSVSFVAPANVQNVTLTGTAALTATGNSFANTLTANSGNDTLTAGSGVATLVGGSGNDTFDVNNASDVVQAQAGANTNIVESSVSYVAPANVQNLTLTGSAALTATGNSLNGTLTANTGDDTLVAGSGVDTLVGGSGSDTFVVNNAKDAVQAQSTGINTVQTSVSYTAPLNVQNLDGIGTANLVLTGNAEQDTITATSGNDTLVAGSGGATLIGGTGVNTFILGYGMGPSTAVLQSSANGIVQLGKDVAFANVNAEQSGNDLVLTIGTTGELRLKNYFTAPQAWTIQDAQGTTTTAQTLLDATTQAKSNLLNYLESEFTAQVEGAYRQDLLSNGYVEQADGSWAIAPTLSGTVSETKDVSTDTITDLFLNPDGTESSSSSTTTNTSWSLNNSEVLASASGAIQTTLIGGSAAAIDAPDPVALSFPSAPKEWLSVNWSALTLKTTTTSNNVVYDNTNSYGNSVDPYSLPLPGSQTIMATTDASTTSVYQSSGAPTGPLSQAVLASPGTLSTGLPNPQVVPLAQNKTQVTYTVQTIDVASGSHTVTGAQFWPVSGFNAPYVGMNVTLVNAGSSDSLIENAGFVVAGSGNDTIDNAQIVYCGTGNDTIDSPYSTPGTTVYGGSGQESIIGARDVLVGSGNDTIFGDGPGTITVDPAATGADLIGNTSNYSGDYEFLDAYYRSLGLNDGAERYQYGNLYYVAVPGFGSSRLTASVGTTTTNSFTATSYITINPDGYYSEAAGLQMLQGYEPNVTLAQAIANGWMTYINPFPSGTPIIGLEHQQIAPAAYYANDPITQTFVANDFSSLAPYFGGSGAPAETIAFKAGVTLSDLTLSWGMVMTNEGGGSYAKQSPYATLNISWGQGGSLQVVMPHRDQPMGAGVQQFTFADGTTVSMAEMISRAPSAPTFDPEIFNFSSGMGQQTVPSYAQQVIFGAGMAFSDLSIAVSGNDLIISDSTGDSATITNGATNANAVTALTYTFSDGSTLSYTGDNSGDATFIHYASGNQFIGQYVGDKWVRTDGNRGTGSYDTLTGTASGTATLAGGTSISWTTTPSGTGSLSGATYAGAALTGGTGNDSVLGFGESDTLTAGSGNNYLYSTGNSDVMVAGTGNDTLVGTGNSDSFVFNTGDGADTIIAMGSNDTVASGSGSTVTMAGNNNTLTAGTGSTVTVGGANNSVNCSGTGNTLVVEHATNSGATISDSTVTYDANNAAFLVQGAGNQINVASGVTGDLALVLGQGNTVDVASSGNTFMLLGTGNVLDSGSAAETVTGYDGGSTVTVGGGSSVNLSGTGNAVTDNGTGSTVNLDYTTTDNALTVSGDTVNYTGSNSSATITGANNTIAMASGVSGDSATVVGDNNSINAQSAGNTFVLQGTGDTLTGAGAQTVTDSGGNQRVTVGGGSTVTVNAGGDEIMCSATGTTVDVESGKNYSLMLSGDTVNYDGSNISADIFDPNNTINVASGITGDMAVVLGNDNVLNVQSAGNTFQLDGGGDTLVGAGAETVYDYSSGSSLTTGSGSTVYFDTANGTATVGRGSTVYFGGFSGNTLTCTGTASTVNLNRGSDNTVSGTGDVVNYQYTDTSVTIDGASNTIGVASGVSGDTATVIGAGNTIDALSGGNTFVLQGTGDTLNGSGNAFTMGGNAVATVAGDGNTITSSASGDTLNLTGNNNTADMSGATLALADGVAATVVGGNDTVSGGTNDTVSLNSASDLVQLQTGGINTVLTSVSYVAPANVQNLFATGAGDISLTANALNDYLLANTGNDTLTAGAGTDVLQGGTGNSQLTDTVGVGALLGSSGSETLTGGGYNDFLAGGSGSDGYVLGDSSNVISFNQGDGTNSVTAAAGGRNTLSLGAGLDYSTLSFSKSANNLVLTAGADSLTFENWYASSADQNFVTLQVIEKANTSYSASSSNELDNQAVVQFGFQNLVNQFNSALAADPALTQWSLSNGLLSAYLGGSNTAAVGGDLAYYDGLNGNLTGMNVAAAQAALQNGAFGTGAQSISTWSSISQGAHSLQ